MGRAVILASPFLIGLVWGFISPFLVRRLANRFEDKLNQELADAGYQEAAQPGPDQAASGVPARETKRGLAAADAGARPVQAPATVQEGDCSRAVPLPTRPANLRTYVEWLVDTPQLLPTILLSVAGVVVAIAEARHVRLTLIVCAVAAVIGIIATRWIMRMDAQRYSGVFRLGIFTIGTLIAIVINFAAAVVIIIGVAV